jgi:hypothetical protein
MLTQMRENPTHPMTGRVTMRLSLALLLGIGVFATSPAVAETIEVPCQLRPSGESGVFTVETSSGTAIQTEPITIEAHEDLVFAELTFHEELPAGTEVEIWPVLEGETPAWELATPPVDRNVWITDERTESLVRFDVTAIVRAWERGDFPNLGLTVRLPDTVEAPAGNVTPEAVEAPMAATLSYRVVVMRPAAETPKRSREGKNGKLPERAGTGGE